MTARSWLTTGLRHQYWSSIALRSDCYSSVWSLRFRGSRVAQTVPAQKWPDWTRGETGGRLRDRLGAIVILRAGREVCSRRVSTAQQGTSRESSDISKEDVVEVLWDSAVRSRRLVHARQRVAISSRKGFDANFQRSNQYSQWKE